MSAVLKFDAQLESHNCPTCFLLFAVPPRLIQERRADKGSFYCPNGHSMSFKESEADRLKRQLEAERNRVEFYKRETEQVKGELRGAKIQLTKARNKLTRTETKVSKGVCPCCNRTFQNVQRHMHTKHPDYANAKAEGFIC